MKKLFISVICLLFLIGCSGGVSSLVHSMLNLDIEETMEFKLYKSNKPQKYFVKKSI